MSPDVFNTTSLAASHQKAKKSSYRYGDGWLLTEFTLIEVVAPDQDANISLLILLLREVIIGYMIIGYMRFYISKF